MPTPEGQNYKSWSKVLDGYKNEITQQTTFICHSISPIFVIHYCIDNNIKIEKLISVCGFNTLIGGDLDKINKTMFMQDITPFAKLCKHRICFYSDNDPYLKLEYCKKFALDIKAKEIIIKGGMHLNTDAGYLQFPQLLEYIK